ncbi:hypothetical protein [Angustibacter luteus]|uniref:Uncharacterized protein n=1 Tax=Angustibacter luteus TaxID=658456 RepID=A0ABW1JIP8_9ACTN
MLDTIFGLPMHPLVVHATVVVVPTAAVAVGTAAAWPRFRRWAGPLPLVLSLLAVVLVPLSTSSGESLERRVPQTALLREHTQIADGLLVWVIVLAVAAAALHAVQWIHGSDPEVRWHARFGWARSVVLQRARLVSAVVAVLTVVGVAGTVVQVARIGHSGAKAAWSTKAEAQPR